MSTVRHAANFKNIDFNRPTDLLTIQPQRFHLAETFMGERKKRALMPEPLLDIPGLHMLDTVEMMMREHETGLLAPEDMLLEDPFDFPNYESEKKSIGQADVTNTKLNRSVSVNFKTRYASVSNITPNEFEDLLKSPGLKMFKPAAISMKELAKMDLMPAHKIVFGNYKYFISPLFDIGGRPACICYFYRPADNGNGHELYVRAFYKSNSHAIWKVDSHRVHIKPSDDKELDEARKGWFGKGINQESVTLPSEIQSSMNEIISAHYGQNLAQNKKLNNSFYRVVLKESTRRPPKEFTRSMVYEPEISKRFAHFKKPNDPESLEIYAGYGPELDKPPLEKYSEYNEHYRGIVDSYVINSKNGALHYIFNVSKKRKVWISAVQSSSALLTRFGVKREKIKVPTGLMVQAQEYLDEIPKGFAGKRVHSVYYDASAWVDKLPINKEFREKVLHNTQD